MAMPRPAPIPVARFRCVGISLLFPLHLLRRTPPFGIPRPHRIHLSLLALLEPTDPFIHIDHLFAVAISSKTA